MEILNPAKADAYYNSCAASQVSPYSAPEILLRHKVHPHCDYYSLGIIIYEMMTQDVSLELGSWPLPEETARATRAQSAS